MHQDSAGLPSEFADRITEPFARFLKIEAAAGGMLLIATIAALILSNSAWSAPFLAFWETPVGLHFGSLDFTRSLRHWINDGLMTFFFLSLPWSSSARLFWVSSTVCAWRRSLLPVR